MCPGKSKGGHTPGTGSKDKSAINLRVARRNSMGEGGGVNIRLQQAYFATTRTGGGRG